MKRRRWILYALLLILAFPGLRAGHRNAYPLPEEQGTAGILAALEKLPVYVRLLQTTAHPDDESAATLTWLSRKFHAQTALFCLTRGEGGQNILGSEKYEALGLVRTGELFEACRYYGTDLYFGKVLDFGFSKTAEETLAKWGREATLEDMVRFIRRWRPAVILSRFQGSPMDGHGHHQAAGILTREAFRAASDPKSFPGQLKDGLQIWKPGKLYISTFGGEFSPGSAGLEGDLAGWTVRVPVGDYDPVLGRSYREIASEGYSKHRTQGNGAAFSLPGRAYEYFKLVDSSVGIKPKEDSFFDSIDTSLGAIFDLAGIEKSKIPSLQEDLAAASRAASAALHEFRASSPEASAAGVAKGAAILIQAIRKVESSSLSAPTKVILDDALKTKLADFQKALSVVLGIYFIARSEDATGIAGEKAPVAVYFYNRGTEPVSLRSIKLLAPGSVVPTAANSPFGVQPAGSAAVYRYSVDISRDAPATEAFWHLENSRDARYKIRQTEDEFAPFGKAEITAEVVYLYQDLEVPIQAIARAQAGDSVRGADFVEFQVVPALSISVEPDFQIASNRAISGTYTFRVSVLNNQKGEARGTLKLISEAGWRAQPVESEFRLSRKGETNTASFVVQVPAGVKTGSYPVEAVATLAGQEYHRGYQVVSYPENWTRNFYRDARSRIEKFEIKLAPKLTVGYIPGAGDDVPGALEQLGVKVQVLSAADLAFGDLSRFSAIVTGIRAYNVNEDLRANNRRLLNYAAQGGTLIVQYLRPMGRPSRGSAGSPFEFGPYPMSVSDSDRITVEDAPIKLLDPSNPILNLPNKITEADFQGWVQERGLYFMSAWDSHYKALLSGNDPGEGPRDGGMLYARYGKGHYIYTGYSWFRQLPAGVPGAIRIFANMLSLGRR
jgi:LmbE family N-acetylglucosaminyl deacetylase